MDQPLKDYLLAYARLLEARAFDVPEDKEILLVAVVESAWSRLSPEQQKQSYKLSDPHLASEIDKFDDSGWTTGK